MIKQQGAAGPQWSAPFFVMEDSQGLLGLSVGGGVAYTLYAIYDADPLETLRQMMKWHGHHGTEADSTWGAGSLVSRKHYGGRAVDVLVASQGASWGREVTLSGLRKDRGMNKALYGRKVTPEEVFVAGAVAPPPCFAPVAYRLFALAASQPGAPPAAPHQAYPQQQPQPGAYAYQAYPQQQPYYQHQQQQPPYYPQYPPQ